MKRFEQDRSQPPFGLSLSKSSCPRRERFDRLNASGGFPFGLSLSKSLFAMRKVGNE